MAEETAKQVRERLSGDPHRPLYHFLPPQNWMNDPNGLIQWNGTYHLFYQHNPDAAVSGNIHWGHAVSMDMLHWQDSPIALSPTQGGWDHMGCWSGCAINYHHIPTLIYTARNVEGEMVCLATSQDDLITWQKHPRNPILALPPKDIPLTGFRDPFVWQNGLGWNMIIGSGYPGKGGAVFLYRSNDLMRWELCGSLFELHDLEYGDMWECPNLLHLGEKYLLFVSVMGQGKVIYFSGDLQDGKFIPQQRGNFDAGGSYYAPLSFYNEAGRAIVFGWAQEGRSVKTQQAAGWSGVQAIPRQLSLSKDGRVTIEPIQEIEALRGEVTEFGEVQVASRQAMILPLTGDCLEIQLEALISDGSYGIRVRCAPDGQEYIEIGYDGPSGKLYVDRRKSSNSPDTTRDIRSEKLDLQIGDRLELRIFVDRSILEVIANKHWCLTSRIYPENKDSLGVQLFSRAGETIFENLKGWQMERIWPG